ncbi:MAG TPA: Mur ligase family protein, partial [Gaiellales bacterium]|nr:Mur ligase family protein [Gaiellales bacterium]
MNGRFLVLGLRRSGLAACEAIARMWPEAQVVAADPAEDVDRERLSAVGAEYVGGGEGLSMSGVRALIKSPGVAGEARLVEAARAARVPVWSEVELASRMLSNPIVGVTGTNGKTTTTELVGRMLEAAGVPVEVAGNVGRALSELPGRIDPGAWIACELSSFQLE